MGRVFPFLSKGNRFDKPGGGEFKGRRFVCAKFSEERLDDSRLKGELVERGKKGTSSLTKGGILRRKKSSLSSPRKKPFLGRSYGKGEYLDEKRRSLASKRKKRGENS